MQFTTLFAAGFALAAGAVAQTNAPSYDSNTPTYPVNNSTGTTGGSGTAVGSAIPSGTGVGGTVPYNPESAGNKLSTGAMGLIAVGSLALVSTPRLPTVEPPTNT